MARRVTARAGLFALFQTHTPPRRRIAQQPTTHDAMLPALDGDEIWTFPYDRDDAQQRARQYNDALDDR